MDAFTPRTITTKEGFWNEIHRIREVQYAVNDGEHYDALGAIAVPVPDEDGKVTMSVSLGYPRQLVVDDRPQVESLVSLAHEIAKQLTLRLYGSS